MDAQSASSSRDGVLTLLAIAEALPYGSTQIDIVEQAVRTADTLNDLDMAYHARQELVKASMFGGRLDITLVAFAWCVAQFDANPGRFNSFELLWRFKWVVSTLPQFPQMSKATIDRMLEDMERRFIAAGSSMQPVWHKRRSVEMMMGNVEAAAIAHKNSIRLARNYLSDCHACEIDSLVEYYMDLGKGARLEESRAHL